MRAIQSKIKTITKRKDEAELIMSDGQHQNAIMAVKTKPNSILMDGFEISFKDRDLINLTRLWKSAGCVSTKRPFKWKNNADTQALIQLVLSELNGKKRLVGQKFEHLKKSDVIQSFRGRNGSGTFVHWKLALAYAAFLSPKAHTVMMYILKNYFGWGENADTSIQN